MLQPSLLFAEVAVQAGTERTQLLTTGGGLLTEEESMVRSTVEAGIDTGYHVIVRESAYLVTWNVDQASLGLSACCAKLLRSLLGGHITMQRFREALHPDDRFRIDELIDLATQNRCSVKDEVRLVSSDGAIRWISFETFCSRDGRHAAASHFVLGTSPRRDRVHEQNELLARIMEFSEQPIAAVNMDFSLGFFNRAFQSLTGYNRDELKHMKHASVLTPSEFMEIEHDLIGPLQGSKKAVRYEKDLIRKNGSRVPIEILVHLLKDVTGQPLFYYAFLTDVTEHKKHDEALDAARREAERANSAKSRFLAAASHDLRQPLSALELYVGTLKEKLTATPLELIVRNIHECVTSLAELLVNLLDVSKLDAGVVKPKTSTFLLDDVLRRLVSIYSVRAQQKGLQLRYVDSRLSVRTDPVVLSSMVANLIANAIRYTHQGGALLGCRRHDGKFWIEVWDTGVGIPEGNRQEIFDEFKQLSHGPGNEGSGLGLAIVAKAASLLGLRIRVKSKVGSGSMFAIELPTVH